MRGPVHWLLSDRRRGAKAGICLAAAAGIVAWGAVRGPETTRHFSVVIGEPESYWGEEVAAGHRRVIRGEDGVVRLGPFVLFGPDAARIPAGASIISFRGMLDPKNRIRVTYLHIHRFEELRLGVSAAALAAVVALLVVDRRRRR